MNHFHWINSFAKNLVHYMIKAVLLLTVGTIAGIAPYFGIYYLINNFISGKYVGITSVVVIAVCIAACLVLKTYSTSRGLASSHYLAYKTLANMRIALADKLLRIPMGKIMEKGSGELKKAFIENIEDMELILAHTLPEGLSNLLSCIIATFILAVIDWRMALLSLAVLPIGIAAFAAMLNNAKTRMEPYYKASRKMNETIVEYISGMEVIKVFSQTTSSFQKYKESVEECKRQTLDWFGVSWNYMAIYSIFLPATLLFMIPFGICFYLSGSLTLEDFILCCLLAMSLGPSLLRIVEFIPMLPQLGVKAQKLELIFKEIELHEGNVTSIPRSHNVTGENITFGYGEENVLHNVSFTARENTVTAFVGESGAGKSTLAKLLVRFWDVNHGAIRIGGINIRDISYQTLSDMTSYVSQDTFLFNTSILENIRIGRPGASDKEVIAISKAAWCHEFIMGFPKGYETVVGDAGDKLSGGQRQRIAIARAMLKNAPIVVLDEATSFTDPENEDKIQGSLNQLLKDKTVIVIAHRLATIQNADNIIVLDQGKIVAQGTHSHLLTASSYYKRMWDAYTQSVQWNVRDAISDLRKGGMSNA